MSRTIVHRGPDDGDYFLDTANGIALTTRRLAVVDLSPQGRQPMRSACGRYVMVFNGEIYNHALLRADLIQDRGNSCFRGHSDTETLLEAAAAWGMKETLRRAVGMFALAFWDARERVLTLARDRIGEKPLYFGWSNGTFLFGSELKALRTHPHWDGTIDRGAEALYFQFGYVPGPASIYIGIGKLPAGTMAVLQRGAGPQQTTAASGLDRLLDDPGGRVRTTSAPYWSAASLARDADTRRQVNDAEAASELDRLLRSTIRRQLLADVPVGTLLSGGIDSSVVTAIAQAESLLPVKSFTIGFDDPVYDESDSAALVAKHLRVDHTILTVTPRDALEVIPHLPAIYDEPFADSSAIPTYLVARLAKTKVTVALCGDGGDEMFGGYNRHYWVDAFWSRMRGVPMVVRRLAASALLLARPQTWSAVMGALARVNPSLFRHQGAGDKLHKLAGVLAAEDPSDMYDILTTVGWAANSTTPAPGAVHRCLSGLRISEQIMLLDAITYLPDDILVKVDRASMAVSLETRAPFLDHHLVEFAWSLPVQQKIRAKTGKWLLREVLYKYVPRELFDRPKAGFGIPVGDWLRGPLREWAESLLTPEKLNRQEAVPPSMILRRWKEHLSGARNWTEAIWCALIYQAWLDQTTLDTAGTRVV